MAKFWVNASFFWVNASFLEKSGHMLRIYSGRFSNVARCPDLTYKPLKKKERQS